MDKSPENMTLKDYEQAFIVAGERFAALSLAVKEVAQAIEQFGLLGWYEDWHQELRKRE